MSKLRTIRRNVERKHDEDVEDETIPDNHLKLPVGQVLVSPDTVKGEYIAIPLLGWFARRLKTRIPLVMIRFMLFDADTMPSGIFQVEFPVYPETEHDTLRYLEDLGWDGRIWPENPGWPDGDEVESANLRATLETAGLSETLVFPPKAEGAATTAVKVVVERETGPFVMPALEKATGEEKHYDRFRELCSRRWN